LTEKTLRFFLDVPFLWFQPFVIAPITDNPLFQGFVANPSLKIGVHRAIVANRRRLGILNNHKHLQINYLTTKRMP
tara:strand:+ start:532 stop:759 length:228 start_codon:yes stop_codon:yes gene_type:complete